MEVKVKISKMKFKLITLWCNLLLVSELSAVIVTKTFAPGQFDPVTITELNTVISENATLLSDGYLAQNSSNQEIRFRRHIDSAYSGSGAIPCYYWFRSGGDPSVYLDTESWDNVYWNKYNASDCYHEGFYDGAESGSNNYVILTRYIDGATAGIYEGNTDPADDVIVGVLQYNLDIGNDDNPGKASLLAYAVDANGMTFSQGVSAIQSVPEPTSLCLIGLGGVALIIRRKRQG